MANRKVDASVLVRGLGMGMAFLQALTEEIVEAGGFEEMIHFLTKDTARPLCKKIAEFLVKLPWRIPRSLMERLAADQSHHDGNDAETIDFDSRWFWDCIGLTKEFGIPITSFNDDRKSSFPPIPKDLLDQIIGKVAFPYMILIWRGESYIIVNGAGLGIHEGCITTADAIDENSNLGIAPAKYFNLEQ